MSSQDHHTLIPTPSAVFRLAWPLGINALLLHGVMMIDTALVAPLGEGALAAMGLAGALTGLLIGVIFSLSNAIQILVAQAQGADDVVGLKSALLGGMAVTMAATLCGLGIVAVFAADLFAAFAHTPMIAVDAMAYLRIFAVVILCEAISQPITCHFNGTGRPRVPLYSRLAEMPLNIGLSVALIHGLGGLPALGLAGAAAGSAVAAGLRLVFLSVCLWRFDAHVLRVPGWSQGGFLRVAWFGLVFALPIAGTFMSNTLANSVGALLFARMEIHAFAAMTVIMPWVMVVGVVMMCWAQATGIFVGQLLGRRAPDAVLSVFLAQGWRVALSLAGFVSLLYLAASLAFPWIYPDLQPATLDALWSFLPVLLIFTFPKISNAMCGNTLRAGGDTVYVMNIFLISQWGFRMPMTALLILYLDAPVAWVFALFLLEELVKFPLFHLRFRSGLWRTAMARRRPVAAST